MFDFAKDKKHSGLTDFYGAKADKTICFLFLTSAGFVPIKKLQVSVDIYRSKIMGIQNWSENIILVDLPDEPDVADELKTVMEIARDKGDVDVVIDFSSVYTITSSHLSALLRLRKLLLDCGHRLVFCGLAPAIKGVFTTTGIQEIFEFMDDKLLALTSLQIAG